ncbi:MAG TPA: hypothetical protein VIU12_08075 [Chryseolinea sp.]
MGAAVNLASRLCGIARAGEILLNENTFHSAYQKEQPRAALPYFQQSANIADQLAKLDPANTEWQRDLSVGYQQLAHINREIGDLESSHAWYLKSFAIASTLSDKDPVNASLLQDKGIAHFDLGKILGLLKRPGEAREQLTLADQIYRRLIERDSTNEELKSECEEVEAAQKRCPSQFAYFHSLSPDCIRDECDAT